MIGYSMPSSSVIFVLIVRVHPRRKSPQSTRSSPGKARSAELEASYLRFALHAALLDGCRALQPAMQITNEIVRRLDADREAQQRFRDAGDTPCLRIHRSVRHRRRMRDQALDAAERLGERE